ncbi:peptidylprolyl isomerase [Pedobacter panaciterrae]
MRTSVLTLLLLLFALITNAQSAYVRLITNKGNITLVLYDQTPKHRDMFLQAIKKGLYNNAQFNRVIKSFVSQGGSSTKLFLKEKNYIRKYRYNA